ncbi:hypothetical protein QQS21_012418 [Conoideocrella luteorostrata]|uniref:Sucrose transporter n=1 Tax=Conoideocrella luteorostrata TaxID=1105319 RepID=A0AAJ0FME0_9HYPO|nr:hypothetical protein QQS21_012418 [Conoideocrella luteorostrata]
MSPLHASCFSVNTIDASFTWGIEMTSHLYQHGSAKLTMNRQDCTPYLLNLGLTKSNTSLIWIAGPLSGLLVQPIIGVISDENTSKWGRRRPFMVIGAVNVAACLLVLGFTKEIVEFFMRDEMMAKGPTIALAVMSIYALDFAINAGKLSPCASFTNANNADEIVLVMSCSRSLIVDCLPLEKQQSGAAWGNVVPNLDDAGIAS